MSGGFPRKTSIEIIPFFPEGKKTVMNTEYWYPSDHLNHQTNLILVQS